MDDILKVLFVEELRGRDISGLIKTYSSMTNKILVDYKSFIDNIVKKKQFIDTNFTVREKAASNNISPRRNENATLSPRRN